MCFVTRIFLHTQGTFSSEWRMSVLCVVLQFRLSLPYKDDVIIKYLQPGVEYCVTITMTTLFNSNSVASGPQCAFTSRPQHATSRTSTLSWNTVLPKLPGTFSSWSFSTSNWSHVLLQEPEPGTFAGTPHFHHRKRNIEFSGGFLPRNPALGLLSRSSGTLGWVLQV